jgi:hypothetical protein
MPQDALAEGGQAQGPGCSGSDRPALAQAENTVKPTGRLSISRLAFVSTTAHTASI